MGEVRDIKTININLFGAPGSGKSTCAPGLFHEMKKAGKRCEYVQEFAKDLVYSKDIFRLEDQTYILAKQHHPIFKLNKQVEYTINDGPFLLGLIYVSNKDRFPILEFKKFVLSLWNRYEHKNYFLKRDGKFEYENFGRNQTLEESELIEQEIMKMLDSHNIPYKIVNASTAKEEILEDLNII